MNPLLYESMRNGREIRRFTDEKIQAAIDEAMDHLDRDTPTASVAHFHMDESGRKTARISVATRVGDDISIQAAAFAEWGGGTVDDLGVGAKVVWTP